MRIKGEVRSAGIILAKGAINAFFVAVGVFVALVLYNDVYMPNCAGKWFDADKKLISFYQEELSEKSKERDETFKRMFKDFSGLEG